MAIAEHARPRHRGGPAGRGRAGRASSRPTAASSPTAVTDDDGRVGDLAARPGARGLPPALRHRRAGSRRRASPRSTPRSSSPSPSPGRRALPRAAAAEPLRLLDLPWQLSMAEQSRRRSACGPAARSSTAPSGPVAVRLRDGVDRRGRRVRRRRRRARRWSCWPTTRCCCRGSWTPTSTSTSRAAPSGRASPARPAPRPPAASPRSSTCRSTASRRPPRSPRCEAKRAVAAGPGLGRRRLLGRRGPGQRRRPGAPPRRRRLRLQVLPARLRRGGVPPPRRRPSSPTRWPRPRGSGALHGRARRGRRRDHRRAPTGGVRAASWTAGRTPRRSARSRSSSTPPRRTGARAHVVHLSAAGAVPALRAARADGRRRLSVETCPHYLFFEAASIADGATELKCCPPIRDADQPRRPVAGARRGRHRLRRHRPLAVHRRAQAPGDGRLRRRLGWDRLAPAGPARRLDRRPRARRHASPRWCAGWRPPRPAGSGWPARARSRVGRRRGPLRLRARRGVGRRRGARCTTRTRSRPTPGVRSPAPCAQTWLRGRPVDLSRPAARPAAEERRAMTRRYCVPTGGLPPPDRADHRPGASSPRRTPCCRAAP